MSFKIRNLIFIVLFNMSLFFLLMIGIQNSSTKKKVNLIIQDTIMLPISFIVGVSFISGTITGSVLSINKKDRKHNF